MKVSSLRTFPDLNTVHTCRVLLKDSRSCLRISGLGFGIDSSIRRSVVVVVVVVAKVIGIAEAIAGAAAETTT